MEQSLKDRGWLSHVKQSVGTREKAERPVREANAGTQKKEKNSLDRNNENYDKLENYHFCTLTCTSMLNVTVTVSQTHHAFPRRIPYKQIIQCLSA